MSSKRYRLKLATWIVVREAADPSPRQINSPDDAARLATELVRARDDDKEHFWVMLLNQRHHYLMHTEVSVGNQSASLEHPREVFGPAVREGAAVVPLVHNHPCGNLLGMNVLDHVIVGNGTGRWFSFRDVGEL
jgi:DNA repair protein RadC